MPTKKPPKAKAKKKLNAPVAKKKAPKKNAKKKEKVETVTVDLSKSTVGRPPKYDPDIHPHLVMELMKQGMFPIEVAAEFDICEETFYQWVRTHPEFSESYKRGQTKKRAWMINKMRTNLVQPFGASFNSTGWSMLMRNDGFNTDSRTVKLPDWKESLTYEEKANMVGNALAEGELTPKEAKLITDKITADVGITEHTKMFEKLKEIVKKFEEKE